MATHAKHKQAQGLGYGVALIARLAADYEGHAATLRKTIELITLDQSVRKHTTVAGALDRAMAMDAARREHDRAAVVSNGARAPKRRAPAGTHTARRRQKREATAALLATFDPVEPRNTGGGVRLGVLIQHGFLKRKGKGYIRTPKPFHP